MHVISTRSVPRHLCSLIMSHLHLLHPGQTDLKGRVALITGAASGIGLRTARSLARMGARVYIADVNEVAGRAAAEALQKDGRDAHFISLDLGTLHSAQRGADAFLKREERLDILGASDLSLVSLYRRS